jgi:hypothetical protein
VKTNWHPVGNLSSQYGLHTFARIHTGTSSAGNLDSAFVPMRDELLYFQD